MKYTWLFFTKRILARKMVFGDWLKNIQWDITVLIGNSGELDGTQ
jgi:hypothetical protein